MFLLEEAGPLKLDQFEGVSSVNLARHFLNFFYKKKKNSSGGASCGAGMKGRWLELLLGMEPLGKAVQCQGVQGQGCKDRGAMPGVEGQGCKERDAVTGMQ